MSEPLYPCACCGQRTLAEEPPGTYAICPVCDWEDDPVQAERPDYAGGANVLSLDQARAAAVPKLLSAIGIDTTPIAYTTESWTMLARLLAALDLVARNGSVALVKVDGARSRDVYTVVLTGGRLGDEPFRRDGANLEALLIAALIHYTTNARPAAPQEQK